MHVNFLSDISLNILDETFVSLLEYVQHIF